MKWQGERECACESRPSSSLQRFSSVLSSAESRTEVIVSFLALLELVKQRTVTVSQESMWGDITIAQAEAETVAA